MAFARPFAYNPGSEISGTTQLGNLSMGTPITGFTSSPQFWNGPDEDAGYIIAIPVSGNTQPTEISGVTASIGFYGTSGFSDVEFIQLAEIVSNEFGNPQTFANASDASTWLTANGFFNSFVPTPGITSTPTLTPTGTPLGTTPTPTPTMYYYSVSGYSCGVSCTLVGSYTVMSPTPLTIGYFYNNPENRGYTFEILSLIPAVGGAYDLTGEPGYADCTTACVGVTPTPTPTLTQTPTPTDLSSITTYTISACTSLNVLVADLGPGAFAPGDVFYLDFTGSTATECYTIINKINATPTDGSSPISYYPNCADCIDGTTTTYTISGCTSLNVLVADLGPGAFAPGDIFNMTFTGATPNGCYRIVNKIVASPTDSGSPLTFYLNCDSCEASLVTPTPTTTSTPTNTPTVTPTPSTSPIPVTGYSFNLVALPYNFPSSGNTIMNGAGGATSGTTNPNVLATGSRGLYWNSIDSNGIDRTSYFSQFTGQSVTITMTQTGSTAIYSGDSQSLKSWSQSPSTGFVFGSAINVPPLTAATGAAVLIQSASTQWTLGLPVYISVVINGAGVTPTPTLTPTQTGTPLGTTPTPTLTPTQTGTPLGTTPTPTLTPTQTGTPASTPTGTPSITPTGTPIAETPTLTPTQTPTGGPINQLTVYRTYTENPSGYVLGYFRVESQNVLDSNIQINFIETLPYNVGGTISLSGSAILIGGDITGATYQLFSDYYYSGLTQAPGDDISTIGIIYTGSSGYNFQVVYPAVQYQNPSPTPTPTLTPTVTPIPESPTPTPTETPTNTPTPSLTGYTLDYDISICTVLGVSGTGGIEVNGSPVVSSSSTTSGQITFAVGSTIQVNISGFKTGDNVGTSASIDEGLTNLFNGSDCSADSGSVFSTVVTPTGNVTVSLNACTC